MTESQVRFDGRVAIVTGGGRGLGMAYARVLAARGAAVVVNDLGCEVSGEGADPAVAEAAASAIRAEGGRAVAHTGDVSVLAQAADLVDFALATFGRLDIVVANAAIRRGLTISETTVDDVQAHVDSDLFGTMLVCQSAWSHFESTGYGRVVISSSSAIFGTDRAVPYALAKGAVTVLGRSFAIEAESHAADIKVNVIAPYGLTRMLGGVFDADPEALKLRKVFGAPERAAETVAVLAHEACPVNGNIYACGAGQVKRVFFGETAGIARADLTAEYQLDHWDEIDSLVDWGLVDGGTAEYSRRIYARAAELFTPAS